MFPISGYDDPDSLRQRLLPIEYRVQIETLKDFAEDCVQELVREKPLVRPGERKILKEAKRVARLLYPYG